MPKVPSREWLLLFSEAADAYREAFREVQNHLRDADMGRIPAWCFAIDRMDLDDVEKLSTELAVAEQNRRRRRVALHALAELIALTGDTNTRPGLSADPEALVSSLEGDADAELDRFITVINYAKSGGVIYVNGTFEPVSTRASMAPMELPPKDSD